MISINECHLRIKSNLMIAVTLLFLGLFNCKPANTDTSVQAVGYDASGIHNPKIALISIIIPKENTSGYTVVYCDDDGTLEDLSMLDLESKDQAYEKIVYENDSRPTGCKPLMIQNGNVVITDRNGLDAISACSKKYQMANLVTAKSVKEVEKEEDLSMMEDNFTDGFERWISNQKEPCNGSHAIIRGLKMTKSAQGRSGEKRYGIISHPCTISSEHSWIRDTYDNLLQRLESQIQKTCRERHPNLVPVIDTVKDERSYTGRRGIYYCNLNVTYDCITRNQHTSTEEGQ